jgi:YbbR domain-containing protein
MLFRDLARTQLASLRRPLAPVIRLLNANTFRRNLGVRIISLLLAIGLWFFVNAGQRGSFQSFDIPLNYRNLPPHFIITGPHPESVKIEVSGPRTLLSIIDPNRLSVKLDLTGVGVGQASFKLGPEAFNLPRMTSVTSISPSQIVLDLDKIETREAPVRLATIGKVTHGYRIVTMEANPRSVKIRGPSKDLARIDQIESEPIDLGGMTGNIERMVALAAPSGMVRIDPAQVVANISLGPIELDKQFRALRIQVLNSAYPVKLQPSAVNVTLHGPQLVLEQLDLRNAVSVDADGLEPGSYDIPLDITPPDGVKLINQSVRTVRLRLYRERRTVRR